MTSLRCEMVARAGWEDYDRFVDGCRWGNVLQTSSWGRLKEHTGWSPEMFAVRDAGGEMVAGAMVLARRVPGMNLPILYAPRGPVCDPGASEVVAALAASVTAYARKSGAILWKVDPSWSSDLPGGRTLTESGFRHVDTGDDFEGIQPRFVMQLPLEGRTADEILADMHHKTRYNIRLSKRRGVEVRPGESVADVDAFYDILKVTASRNEFGIRDRSYFHHLWETVIEPGRGRLFLAHYRDRLLAGTVALIGSGSVWYLYGASSNEHREVMPNYGLQWAMIRWAMRRGCGLYDFRGVSGDLSPDNPLYGLYRFKQGFGAELVELVGEYDLVFRPILYRLWRTGQPLYRSLRDSLLDLRDGLQ
ncbi:MAG: peptidoglycan bridge formation glycyltransferase FemA/FemB family protein [Bacillota bacterium]